LKYNNIAYERKSINRLGYLLSHLDSSWVTLHPKSQYLFPHFKHWYFPLYPHTLHTCTGGNCRLGSAEIVK